MSLFNAPTAPDDGDNERLLLCRIAKILEDARSGDSPLAVDSGGGGGGTTRTPASSSKTGDGTVAAGKKWVQFILSEDFAGTINGVAFAGADGDFLQEFPLLNGGDTYAAIPYTISAGSARLTAF